VTASTRRVRTASAIGVGLGALTYFLTLFDYRPDPLRGATGFRYAEQFFDLQATAIMHGHLAVPQGSMGIEGFVLRGHTYSYFGIFPALLRIPVQMITHEYDGRLTLISMAIAWVVFAVVTTRLYWLVGTCLRPDREVGRLEATVATVVLAAVTGGTTITFDAALPWAYHEVYLWSVASVLGSLYWLLRSLLEPTRAHLRWLFVFLLVASLTRTTGGWAVCLTTIAAAAWLWRGRSGAVRAKAWPGLLAAGLIPLAIAIAINYAKFRHPYMFPLQDQVFTHTDAHRRKILAENGGTLAGPQFFPSAFVNYFRLDGVRFTDYYPWVSFPAHPAHGYGRELDQGYRTGSVTAFMPLLLLMTLVSVPLQLRRLRTFPERAVRLLFLGAFLMTGGVMAYGYIAYRYTSEFVPVLAIGAMVTAHVSIGWLRRVRPRIRTGLLVVAAVLAAYSLVLHALVGHATAATTHRGAPLEGYLSRQLGVSGSTQAYRSLVHHSVGMPTGGRADDLWIRGNCEALYMNTGGDDRIPWVLVQERDTALDVRTGPDVRPGTYPLMRHSIDTDRTVSLRVNSDRTAQLVVDNAGLVSEGIAFDLPPDGQIRVGARNLSEIGAAEISSTPGGFVTYLPTSQWDDKQKPVLSSILALPQDDATLRAHGLSIQPAQTLPLTLCHRIARTVGVKLSDSRG
jgi:hypothetical protein